MVRKSGVLLIGMVLLLASSTGLAFTWNSFRNQSTAGMLDDDYDLLLDPARLPLIEGSRLYTSLANLVGKDEEVFSDTDNGYWLIGGSTKLGEKVYPGAIHDYYILKTLQPCSLATLGGTWRQFTGRGELVDSRFIDQDGNGVYDTKETQHQTVEGWDVDNSSDYYIAIGSYLGTARVGALYLFSDESYEFIDPVQNFTLSRSDTNLIDNSWLCQEDQVSTGDQLDEMSTHAFGLAAWMPAGEQLLVGGQFVYGRRSSNRSSTWGFTQTTDNSPDDPALVDTYVANEGATETIPSSGSIMSAGLRGIYNWTDDVETWLYLNFGQFSADIEDDAAMDYYLFSEQRTTLGTGIEALTDTNRTISDITGDYSQKSLGLLTRTIAKLSEKVSFGIGVGLETGNYEGTSVFDGDRVDRQAYDDGDAQVNDPDDYTEVVTDTLVETNEVTGSDLTLAFPVGVEFEIKKPLVLRLGARHECRWDEEVTTLTRKQSAEHHRLDRGDGSWQEWVDPPVHEPINGESETTEDRWSGTHYYYGLGYRVTDNLQIDLMGFSDLTDLSNWKLSAVFRF